MDPGLHNLAYALNGYKGIHSAEYNRAVYEILKRARETARNAADLKEKVEDALIFMRESLESGGIFWTWTK